MTGLMACEHCRQKDEENARLTHLLAIFGHFEDGDPVSDQVARLKRELNDLTIHCWGYLQKHPMTEPAAQDEKK